MDKINRKKLKENEKKITRNLYRNREAKMKKWKEGEKERGEKEGGRGILRERKEEKEGVRYFEKRTIGKRRK